MDKPDAIGVVAEDSVVVKAQGIHGLGQPGPRRQLVGQCKGLDLEGHRHVHAPPTGTAKGFDGFPELADRPEYRLVAHVLMALTRKRRMKNGRLRVRNGIADYGVAISHGNNLDGQKRDS